MNDILETNNFNFIGAGKILYNNFSPDFNIPHLHFLVIQHDSFFEAVNIELQLFAVGDSRENAVAELATLTSAHIVTVLSKGRGYDELMETAMEETMNNYWKEYRKVEFEAARKKKDIGHNLEQRINILITENFRAMIRERIKEFAIKNAKLIDKKADELTELIFASVPNVLYQEAA